MTATPATHTRLAPVEVTVAEIQPGDLIYLGWSVPFIVKWNQSGFGKDRVLHGRTPPADPFGQPYDNTLDLPAALTVTVHREAA